MAEQIVRFVFNNFALIWVAFVLFPIVTKIGTVIAAAFFFAVDKKRRRK